MHHLLFLLLKRIATTTFCAPCERKLFLYMAMLSYLTREKKKKTLYLLRLIVFVVYLFVVALSLPFIIICFSRLSLVLYPFRN